MKTKIKGELHKYQHNCPFCNDDEDCPGRHIFLDIENATDEQLAEEGLQRITKIENLRCFYIHSLINESDGKKFAEFKQFLLDFLDIVEQSPLENKILEIVNYKRL